MTEQQKVYLKDGDTVQIHGVVTVKLDPQSSGGYAVIEDEGNKHFLVEDPEDVDSPVWPVVWPGQNGAPLEERIDAYYLKPVPATVTL